MALRSFWSIGTLPEWEWLNRIGTASGKPLLSPAVIDDRALFFELVKGVPAFHGASFQSIGELGVPLAQVGQPAAGTNAGSPTGASHPSAR